MITLKTLPQATSQQVFDQVATHLLRQRFVSRNPENDVCAYRGDDGRMCAAGCLIGDDEYKPEIETAAWTTLCEGGKDVPEAHARLIHLLQTVHDSADDAEEVGIGNDAYAYWLRQLRDLAHEEGLGQDKLMYRVIGEDDEVLETYSALWEAEQRTATLEGTGLQCPGDY